MNLYFAFLFCVASQTKIKYLKIMNRNFSTQAIILSIKSSGENNSTVTLLTKSSGILYATLYGGPKSKMKSLVTTWNSGVIYLYENPTVKGLKITDFDVKNYHSSFSQNLFKLWAASLVAEISIKTKCAGSNEQCFNLVSGFLDGLELVNEEQGKLGLIRFLWRYIELLGIRSDSSFCAKCGKSFLEAPSSSLLQQNHFYNMIGNNFICSECGKFEERKIPINHQALSYLTALSVLSPSEVRKLSIDKNGFEQIKQIVFFIIQNNIDSKLNSIETGIGIL